MLGYVMVGTNDIDKAAKFYDTLFAAMGAKREMEYPDFILWDLGEGKTNFSITKPYDGKAACIGNGSMNAFYVTSNDEVDRLYALAMELGASDEGVPGKREFDENFYAGYFRDLDGNKLNFFHYPMGLD
ncbi:MAG: glyoxalase [Gammaproteobacteria bacterium]|nr:MAG: glyoxalase [Gammaproteobacteria bacterium]